MGGFSIGSQLLGMRTTVFVEQNHLACEALRANFTSPVFESDLGNIDTLKRIHALKGPGFNQATGGKETNLGWMITEATACVLSCKPHGSCRWMQCSLNVLTM